MPRTPELAVHPDPASLARAVAGRIADLSHRADARPVAIALSGGSTPKRLYETLAVPPFANEIDWSGVELFFGDERCVPPDHADSNYGMTVKALLSKIPAVKAHRMEADAGAADAYEALVRKRVAYGVDGIPAFDVVLLGMGPDGHTASLFPGTRALDETEHLVVMNEVPQLGTRRMTFTYPLLNAARRVWVLIAGADKKEMVSKCLAAADEPGAAKRWPILGVRPRAGELVWWLDEAARP
jgi:6-phosphogluconolactonase